MPPLMIFGTNLQREELRAMRIDANQKEHQPALDCHYQLASCARKASCGSHFELCKLSIFSLFRSKWNRLKSFDNLKSLATRDTDIVSVIWLIGNQLIISGYVVNHSILLKHYEQLIFLSRTKTTNTKSRMTSSSLTRIVSEDSVVVTTKPWSRLISNSCFWVDSVP